MLNKLKSFKYIAYRHRCYPNLHNCKISVYPNVQDHCIHYHLHMKIFRRDYSTAFKEKTSFKNSTRSYRDYRNEILEYLNLHSISFQYEAPSFFTIKDCPNCHGKGIHTGKLLDGNGILRIHIYKGDYKCSCCLMKGTWESFMQMWKSNSSHQYPLKENSNSSSELLPHLTLSSTHRTPEHLDDSAISKYYSVKWNDYVDVKDYISKKMKLTIDTLGHFEVGIKANGEKIQHDRDLSSSPIGDIFLAFPEFSLVSSYTSPTDVTFSRSHQGLNSNEGKENKDKLYSRDFRLTGIHYKHLMKPFEYYYYENLSVIRGLFGLKTCFEVHNSSEIVITASEIDAMAVWQGMDRKLPVISLSSESSSIPSAFVPLFSKYKKIYLWLSSAYDEASVQMIAKQVGKGRVRVVQPSDLGKDGTAYKALTLGKPLRPILESGQLLAYDRITQFSKFKDILQHEFSHPEKYQGLQSLTLPSLNKILKGLRKGELTLFTGPTGSGKTSILSQLSLDYCSQGLPTLWGSFEIPNVKLMKKMLRQYSNKNFTPGNMTDYEDWCFKFNGLPLYFMNFFGSSYLEDVLEAMNYAVDANGVGHIVLDNLQFMLSGQEGSHGGGSFDKWDLLDKSVAKLRSFSHEKNVHITLVIHPRKENDDTILGIASVTGTAKSTQEADNLIILQKVNGKRWLDIKKNRFDGELGHIHYRFDPESTKIYETSEGEMLEGEEMIYEHPISSKEFNPDTFNLASYRIQHTNPTTTVTAAL